MRLWLAASRLVACCTISLAAVAPLAAHEGHGAAHAQHGPLHYIVNPSHAIPMLVTAAIAAGLAVTLLTKLNRRSATLRQTAPVATRKDA
ncbi:MAG: hypothetical protein RLZZ436_232 [Planctomycetota bacterium]